MQSLEEWFRRVLAYTTLFGFTFFIFLYGRSLAESFPGMSKDPGPLKQDPILDSRTSPALLVLSCLLLYAEN